MKYEVYTTVQGKIVVNASSETEAMEKAENHALFALTHIETRDKIIAAAREANEVDPDLAESIA